jgi:hypothetical protein
MDAVNSAKLTVKFQRFKIFCAFGLIFAKVDSRAVCEKI